MRHRTNKRAACVQPQGQHFRRPSCLCKPGPSAVSPLLLRIIAARSESTRGMGTDRTAAGPVPLPRQCPAAPAGHPPGTVAPSARAPTPAAACQAPARPAVRAQQGRRRGKLAFPQLRALAGCAGRTGKKPRKQTGRERPWVMGGSARGEGVVLQCALRSGVCVAPFLGPVRAG